MPQLDLFIAYALHRTKLHKSVTFAALYLLQCLKARFPAARGSSGHQLFISAFMLSSKVICDDTYSNKPWSIVGQGSQTNRRPTSTLVDYRLGYVCPPRDQPDRAQDVLLPGVAAQHRASCTGGV